MINYYMLSNNVPTTCLVEYSDFPPVSERFGLQAYLMHFRMDDRVTILNDLCTASTIRLVEQIFIQKI